MRPPRTLIALLLAALVLVAAPAAVAATPLSIKVEGNHLVDGEGQTIRLLGVDRTSTEYACAQNYALDDGHFDDADAAAIAAWNADAVRVPLNEDCWLNVNLPKGDPYGGAAYQQEIERYVADLNAHGLYAILDLHWSSPGAHEALGQQPMPDKEYSEPFWESVATAFKANPAVVFDLYNEPYDPTDPRSGDDTHEGDKVTWECWDLGSKPANVGGGARENCVTQAYGPNGETTTLYEIAGMQKLIELIRKVGATQPVMIGGLNYANDLSGWLAHRPVDPLNQEIADFHNYQGSGKCDDATCWSSTIASVAASVPVTTGEFAEDDFENPTCGTRTPSNFDTEYMNWADAHGVGYLSWAWTVESAQEIADEGCSVFTLVTDWAGTPASPNGVAVHSHLLGLPAHGRTTGPPASGGGGAGGGSTTTPAGTKVKLTHFSEQVSGDGTKVSFQITAAEACTGKLSGQTVKRFKLGGKKARPVALGSTHLSLKAGKKTTVTLKLSGPARGLLKAKGSLRSRFTLALSAAGTPTLLHQTATLTEPKPRGAGRHHHKP
jgi:endoglucanase